MHTTHKHPAALMVCEMETFEIQVFLRFLLLKTGCSWCSWSSPSYLTSISTWNRDEIPSIATWHIHLRFHAPRRSTCGSWRLTGDGVVMKWVEIGYIRLIWRYTWYTRVSAFRKKPLFLIQVLSNSSTSLWSTEVGLPYASPNQSLHLSSPMSTQIFYLRLHHPGLIGPSTTG